MSKHATNAGQPEEVVPLAVTSLTATDVGVNQAYNNASVNLSWTLPSNSNAATLYTITSTPPTSTNTTTSTSYQFTGLKSDGTSYTFTVVPSNAAGFGPTATSSSVTPTSVPQAPTITFASDVGTNVAWGNAQANIGFTANGTGGYPIFSYVAEDSTNTFSSASTTSPINVSGMQGGILYSFTVTATNLNGTSIPSSADTVTPTTVPQAPTLTATAGVNQDTVSWSAPDNGGVAITNYHIMGSDGTYGDAGTSTSITIGDSAGNTLYYTGYATNSNGNSITSSPSNSVTTQAPFFPPSFFSPPFFPPFFPPTFFNPPFFPPNFFSPPFFPPAFFSPPFFPPTFFSPPSFFSPPFFPPSFFHPPSFFSPPSFFHPPTFCIEQDTYVLTKDGYKQAKDIVVGDILITKTFDTLPIGDYETVAAWSAAQLNSSTTLESEVTEIIITPQSSSIIINGDNSKRFSLAEDILVVRANEYRFVSANELTSDDQLVTYDEDHNLVLTEIESTGIIEENTMVYDFVRSPFGLIIADSVVVYNAYPDKE